MYDNIKCDFKHIATIDPVGSAFDNYIKSLDIERFDLSNNYNRSNNKSLNLRLLYKLLKKNNYEKTLIFVTSIVIDEFWESDLQNFIRNNDLLFIVYKSGYKCDLKINNVFIQHTPSALNDKDFALKTGAHLSKIITLQKFIGSDIKDYEFPTFCISLDNICDLAQADHGRGFCKLIINNILFEFIYNIKKETKTLVIVGQSAITRTSIGLPCFQRWKWAFDFNASSLIINDPTLYLHDNLNCGWFVGDKDISYAEIFAKEIIKLSKKMSIEQKNIIFYGGSAGGYSSFQLASYIKDSIVIADISQTNLQNYHRQDQICNLTKNIFLSDSIKNIEYKYMSRFDIVLRFIENQNIPSFVFLQNDFDDKHVRSQMLYFIDSLKISLKKNKLKLPKIAKFYKYSTFSPLKGGHVPLGRYTTTYIINDVINSLINDTRFTFVEKFSFFEFSFADFCNDK